MIGWNGKSLPFQETIDSDASLMGWGAVCHGQGQQTRDPWSRTESKMHINGISRQRSHSRNSQPSGRVFTQTCYVPGPQGGWRSETMNTISDRALQNGGCSHPEGVGQSGRLVSKSGSEYLQSRSTSHIIGIYGSITRGNAISSST